MMAKVLRFTSGHHPRRIPNTGLLLRLYAGPSPSIARHALLRRANRINGGKRLHHGDPIRRPHQPDHFLAIGQEN
jgi:hypothetical protein